MKVLSTVAPIIALFSTANAFAPAPATQGSSSTTALNAKMSRAIPFLEEPASLKGYVGDVGFDPMGISTYFDVKWCREAEIKHGRVAMLATVGFVMAEFWTIPGYERVADSNLAPFSVGGSAMCQIVIWMGILEFWTNKGNVTMENMFNDPKRVPGNLGFDPMGLAVGKSEEDMKEMELKEIKNGRLAMLAIGGMIHHNWITGDPLF